jgi:hypothetical protein
MLDNAKCSAAVKTLNCAPGEIRTPDLLVRGKASRGRKLMIFGSSPRAERSVFLQDKSL